MFYVERGRITKSTGTSSEQVPTIYSYHTYALFFLDLVRPASPASIEEDDRLCGHHLLHGLKLYPRQQQQLGLLHAGQEAAAAAAGRDQWTAAAAAAAHEGEGEQLGHGRARRGAEEAGGEIQHRSKRKSVSIVCLKISFQNCNVTLEIAKMGWDVRDLFLG